MPNIAEQTWSEIAFQSGLFCSKYFNCAQIGALFLEICYFFNEKILELKATSRWKKPCKS